MCHFIYLVLPKTANVAAVRGIASQFDRALEPVDSHPMDSMLKPNEAMFRTTKGMCDCGTCLGRAAMDQSGERDFHQDVQKLKKRGWSSAKIDRWLTAKSTSDRRTQDQKTGKHLADTERWLALLRTCLDQGGSKSIGVLLAWEGGATPSVPKADRAARSSLAAMTAQTLMHLKENCIHEFGD